MKINRLDHLNLTVKNLDQSVTWYQNLFGFECRERGESKSEPWAIIQSGLASLCLYQRPGHENHDADLDQRSQKITINHFAFAIEDEAEWLGKIRQFQPNIQYNGAVTEYPKSRSWYVIDPNGFQIEVVIWKNGYPEF